MKQIRILSVLFTMLLGVVAMAQCPTSVSCSGTQFTFNFSTTPNSGNVDTVDVTVNGSVTSLTVASSTSTTIVTNMNGLSCSDMSTLTEYYYQGSSVGISCNTNVQLPVEITDFRATRFDESILLSWVTASELNNSHFEVQKTYDGQTWVSIGLVSGSGNSSKITSYSFIDRETHSVAYRLKQVDYNNTFEYSDILMVEKLVKRKPIRISIIRVDGSITTIDDPQAVIVTEYNDGSVQKERLISNK